MTKKLLFIFFSLLITLGLAADWEYLGAPGFSTATANISVLAVNNNNVPYAAFLDVANSSKISVMKYINGNWEYVGDPGFTSYEAGFISLAFTSDGNPILATSPKSPMAPKILKFNGTNWLEIGDLSYINLDNAQVSLYVDQDIPYITFRDADRELRLSVLKWDEANTTWNFVGDRGFTKTEANVDPTIKVYNGIPYVAYQVRISGVEYGINVMKYESATWNILGKEDITSSKAYDSSLFIYQGTPYIALRESETSPTDNQLSVLKFNGSEWEFVGNRAFTDTRAIFNCLFINSQGIFVAYNDFNASTTNIDLYVMKYNASSSQWEKLGSTVGKIPYNLFGFYLMEPFFSGDNNNLYLAYMDKAQQGKISVKYYELPGQFTPKDQIITAASNNIVVSANGFVKTAAADNIPNAQIAVLEINGLVAERTAVNDTALGTKSANVYKGLIPGQIYTAQLTALSRGNDQPDNDIVQISVGLDDTGPDTWLHNNPINLTIVPWQTQTFVVTVNPVGAYAFERATLNTTISLVPANAPRITSYNAFEAAFIGGTFEAKGIYGGIETLPVNTFALEAEGYDLTILSRSSSVNAPLNYTGEEITSINIVPGTKITYTIVIRNNSTAEATSINLTDKVPANCHLYYTEVPNVEGAVAWVWQGATDNSADQNTADAVKFEITIPAEGIVTAAYTVTLD